MYFGRRVSAFCAAVVVFTLETHDSSLGGPMAHHGAQTNCEGCQPSHTEGAPPIAVPRQRPLPYRVADAGWQGSHHPTGFDNAHAAQPYGGPETPPANGANGWYQIAAGGSEFLGGPGFSGGSGSGSGGQDNGSGGGTGGGSGNGGNSGGQGGDTGSGGGTGGGSGNGGNSGSNPGSGGGTTGGSGNNGNPGDHQGAGNGGTGGGSNGGPPSTGPDTGNGGNGGGNGGGPPVVIIDPPPGGPVDPPNGPVTPPPGGNGNTPGTTPGTTDVPEPASLLIALMGLAGLAAARRRKRSH
jgi:MYXO-CTERM domain-containing protein